MCLKQLALIGARWHCHWVGLLSLVVIMTYCLPAMAQFRNANSSNTSQYLQLKFSNQGRLVVDPDLPDTANSSRRANPVRDLDFPSHGVWDYHPLHPRESTTARVVGQSNNLSIYLTIRGNDHFTKASVVDIVFPWQALEPYIHQTSRTQFIEQAKSSSLSFVHMVGMKISGPELVCQDRLIPAVLPSGNVSADAQNFPELGSSSYIYLGSPSEPSLESPLIYAPCSNTNVRPYWRYVLPNGDGREYSESAASISSEVTYTIKGPHLSPEILYANRISLEPRIDQNFRVDSLDSTGQVIKESFHRNKPVKFSCLEFPQAVPLYFTVSNFKKFLEGKRFDFKQALALARQPYKPNLEAIRQQRLSEQADLKQKVMAENYSYVRSLYYTARRLTSEYLDEAKQESFYYPLINEEIRGQIKPQDINKQNLGQFVQAEKLYKMMTLEFARQPYWVSGYENRRLLEQYAEMLCKMGRESDAEQKYDQVRQIARQQRQNITKQEP